MIFIGSVIESKTEIPYTIILVIIGIIISFLVYLGFINNSFIDIKQFKFDPSIIVNFLIPPLIFEAMIQVDYYKEYMPIRLPVLLLSTVGVPSNYHHSWPYPGIYSSFAFLFEFFICVIDFLNRCCNSHTDIQKNKSSKTTCKDSGDGIFIK